MTAIAIRNFRGAVPRTSPRSLGANQAVTARNCKLTSGRLDPLLGPVTRHTSNLQNLRTVYRYRFEGSDNWLVWQTRVHVAMSPVPGDAFGRLYFTGDSEPRMTTYAAAISGTGRYPFLSYVLGVVPPPVATTVTPSGGVSGTSEARSYLYTYRTALGEESGPSAASALVTGKIDDTWAITGLATAPISAGSISAAAKNVPSVGLVRVTLDTTEGLFAGEELTFEGVFGMTDLNGTFVLQAVGVGTVDVALVTTQSYSFGGSWYRRAPHNTTGMTKRIYRTTGVEFFLVAEVAVGTTTYNDVIPATALGDALPTANVLVPPKDLRNLVVLANGAMAGISGNELCFSDLNRPHSWPLGNRYAFAGEGIALTVVGNSVILLTDSTPIVATASVPDAVSMARLDVYAPCYAEQSATDVGAGCLFASYDGLYLATPGGARKITTNLFTQKEWESLNPRTFVAAFHDGHYFARHASLIAPLSRIFTLDLEAPDGVVEMDETADFLYANPIDGRLYLVQGREIREWDADESNPYTGVWEGREYQLGSATNFACARVHGVFRQPSGADVAQLAANAALMASALGAGGDINADPINEQALNGSNIVPTVTEPVTRADFSLLADGEVVYSRQIRSSKVFRLPSGFLSEVYAVRISFTTPIYSIAVANDTDELASDFA